MSLLWPMLWNYLFAGWSGDNFDVIMSILGWCGTYLDLLVWPTCKLSRLMLYLDNFFVCYLLCFDVCTQEYFSYTWMGLWNLLFFVSLTKISWGPCYGGILVLSTRIWRQCFVFYGVVLCLGDWKVIVCIFFHTCDFHETVLGFE